LGSKIADLTLAPFLLVGPRQRRPDRSLLVIRTFKRSVRQRFARALFALMGIGASRAGAQVPVAMVRDLLRDDAGLAGWVRTRSPTIAASSARVAQAEADVGTSRLIPNPMVDFTVSDITIGRTNPAGLSYSDTSIYGVGLTEMVELGKRGPRIEAAELRLNATKKSAVTTLAERVAEARLALGRVVYLKAKQDVISEELRSATAVSELEKVRLEQGALSGNDYDRLILDKMSLEVESSRAQADFAGALAGCREAMRASCDLSAATTDDLDAAAPVPQVVTDRGRLEARSDIEALRFEREAALREAVLAGRRAIPDPAVRVGFTHDNLIVSGDQENTVSVGILLPLPLFDHGQHDAARARARATELDRTREAALARAAADLEQLRARTALLAQGLSSLRGQALPKSQTILSTTAKAFDRGQVSMTDLLLARRTHVTLLLNVLALRFEFFAARNELRRVLGLDIAPGRTGAP